MSKSIESSMMKIYDRACSRGIIISSSILELIREEMKELFQEGIDIGHKDVVADMRQKADNLDKEEHSLWVS